MWHLRESIPLAQSLEGANIKHDIALPISAVAGFVASTDAALLRAFPGVRLVDFGHLGDGNLHYNVQARTASPRSTSSASPRSTSWSTTRSRRAAARSRPSTASAGSSATTWRDASRRSRSS